MLQPRHPTFQSPNSFSDSAGLCVELVDELDQVVAWLDRPDHDARVAALNSSKFLVGAGAMTMNLLDSGTKMNESLFRALLGIESGPTQAAADALEKSARLAMVTLVQFQVENMLKNCIAATGAKPSWRWQGLSRQAVGLLGWRSPERAERVLKVPAAIRNSLHNNGFHTGGDFTSQVSGYRFRFRQGKRFDQGGWGHVVHALRAELRIVERVLASPAIDGIALIKDAYVEDVR